MSSKLFVSVLCFFLKAVKAFKINMPCFYLLVFTSDIMLSALKFLLLYCLFFFFKFQVS